MLALPFFFQVQTQIFVFTLAKWEYILKITCNVQIFAFLPGAETRIAHLIEVRVLCLTKKIIDI
jgi:hypothetical protein